MTSKQWLQHSTQSVTGICWLAVMAGYQCEEMNSPLIMKVTGCQLARTVFNGGGTPDVLPCIHIAGSARWRHQMEPFNALLWGIHRWPVNSPRKGPATLSFKFSLICSWINDWVNNRESRDLRHHRAHYDVIVMIKKVTDCQLAPTLFSMPVARLTCCHVCIHIPGSAWWRHQI